MCIRDSFTDVQLDTIEILLKKLYARFGITYSTDYSAKKPSDFPVMSDFYAEKEARRVFRI